MIEREQARKFYDEVVIPAIAELIEEYRYNGYDAGVHRDKMLFRDYPPIAETHGIWVILPDGTQQRIAVSWPEDYDRFIVGDLTTAGVSQLYFFEEADKALIKEKIKELIGT